MNVLLDTHAWVWSLMAPSRLGLAARTAISRADIVYVSPISAFEVARKVGLGKWSELSPHVAALLNETQTVSAPLTRAVAGSAGQMDWKHRDPFDRLIAATAIEFGNALVSKDIEFDQLRGTSGWLGRVWS